MFVTKKGILNEEPHHGKGKKGFIMFMDMDDGITHVPRAILI